MKSRKDHPDNEPQVYLKGHLLTAMPALNDPNFSKTVTCICEHSDDGAVGLTINRKHPFLKAKDVFEELGIESEGDTGSIPIHIGGPVHIGEIFILHGPPFSWIGCAMITPWLAMSNTRDILESIALKRGPESFIIALGCAGWAPNQLEMEIKRNSWLTCPVTSDLIFKTAVESTWEVTMKSMGIDPMLISDQAGQA